MRSQSLTAQLLRMSTALVCTLILVKYCQPLQDAFSLNATDAGCHQMPKDANVHSSSHGDHQ
ncbi:hypothetical protein ACVBIL_20305 [Shewanella sp. 125m-7]